MFFICDKNDVIQDIATKRENLARGYDFEDHKVFNTPDMHHATIGDKYKEGLFMIDVDRLAAYQLRADQENMIVKKEKNLAITALKAEGKLPPDYEEVT